MTKQDLKIIDHAVPNYSKGRTNKIKFGVIHFTSAMYIPGFEKDPYNVEENLKVFDVQGAIDQFSAHYMITREGQIYQWVQIQDTAWHAGKSVIAMPVYTENLNTCSVGIELLGKTGDPYTTPQYQALALLSTFIEDEVDKNDLGHIEHWVGHDWIAGTVAVKLGIREPNQVKVDPGTSFDWDIFLREKYRVRLETEVKSSYKGETRDQILAELTATECLSLMASKLFKGKKS